MRKPLYKLNKKDLIWIVAQIKKLKKDLKFKRLTIPIEETCRYKNQIQRKKPLNALNFLFVNLKSNLKFCIETDLNINEIEKVLNDKRFKDLGLLIDLGNIRASNRRIQDYLDKFSDRIFSIHIKFRDKNWGKSTHIPKDFFELGHVKHNFHRLKKINDITFQTFRSDNKFLNDMKRSIKNLMKLLKNKYALITGAGGLLGKYHSEALAEDGFNLIIVDLSKNLLQNLENYLKKNYPQIKVFSFLCDITSSKELNNLNKKLKSKNIFISCLVNNAENNPKNDRKES